MGTALVEQLNSQKEDLEKSLNFGMCLSAIASSTKMFLGQGQCVVSYDDVQELLGSEEAQDLDLDALTAAFDADVSPNRVVIDCTNDDNVSNYYEKWMQSGINVISPGKSASAGPMDRYRAIQETKRAKAVEWHYESSVGSALPILTTLRDLIQTGDDVMKLRGCLSGTMAYVFHSMGEDITFSEAVASAIEQDFAENDIREDLSGMDAAKKMVILARELGLDVSVEDLEVESLLPVAIQNKEYTGTREEVHTAILEDLKTLDGPMLERYREAAAEDKLLRYKFVIDVVNGKYKLSLEKVDSADTLYRLRENENLVAFETKRYTTSPLIVKGAAAGPDLSASGMFADLLRLGRAFVGSQS